MLDRVTTMVNYIRWLIAKQKELQKQCALRIIEVKAGKTGEHDLIIQVINKTTTFQW